MAITIDKVAFKNLSRIGLGSPSSNLINGDVKSESDLQDYIDA